MRIILISLIYNNFKCVTAYGQSRKLFDDQVILAFTIIDSTHQSIQRSNAVDYSSTKRVLNALNLLGRYYISHDVMSFEKDILHENHVKNSPYEKNKCPELTITLLLPGFSCDPDIQSTTILALEHTVILDVKILLAINMEILVCRTTMIKD